VERSCPITVCAAAGRSMSDTSPPLTIEAAFGNMRPDKSVKRLLLWSVLAP
jgi:hypothetical protein